MRGVNLSVRDLRARENLILGVDSAVLVGVVALGFMVLRLLS